ncbi:MAG TPA: hypothetical protein VK388_05020 [Pyrinomonadaceae bacterium]|nr:hypothetical protein [Pyrinomonadaceae bacterium]
MCDLDRVSGFLIAAKIAYIATLIALGVAMLNSASLFAAAANGPLMIGVIAGAALATGLYTAALVELDRCAAGVCAAELQPLRNALVALLATMAVYTTSLGVLALVAWIPFAGAAAVGAMLALFIGLTVTVSTGMEANFIRAVQAYNNCRARNGATTIIGAVIALSIFVIFFGLLFVGVGVGTGRIPLTVSFGSSR